MTQQLLFVQGGGADVHDTWDDKLVASLRKALGPTSEIRYPRMPDEANPQYAPWKAALARETADLRDGAIVVAHSMGAAILINALAEDPPERALGAIILLSAPFVGEGGWPSEGFEPPRDLGAKLPRSVPIHLYQGLADETVPPAHVELYARAIPQAQIHRLARRDHQLGNDLSEVARLIESLDLP